MTLIRRFFSGPSLTQAILAAARHHDVDPDELVYEVIDKKHGFVKMPRGVVIEVDPEQPTKGDSTEAARAEVPGPAPSESAPAQDSPAEVASAPDPPAEEPPAETRAAPAAPASRAAEGRGDLEEQPEESSSARLEALTEPVSGAPAWHSAPKAERLEEDAPEQAPAEPEAPQAEAPAEAPEPEAAPTEAADEAPAPVEEGPPPSEVPFREVEEARKAPPVDAELHDSVARAVDELAHLASLRVQAASVGELDDGLAVELEGPDSDRVVAHGGRALLAMQHLLPRLLFGELGRAVHCRLDCAGFHAARAERLARVAHKAADRVRSGGRSWLLEPMAPDERRLVHLALAEESDVETESVGEGYLKRVRVAQTS